jgi:ATP-dependent DNA helicase RecQ
LFSYSDIRKIRHFIDQKDEQERRIANTHLNRLLELAETGVCRRIPLLKYFGEDYPVKSCHMCDNCSGETKELVDLTIPAQKFLSCVARTGERFGAGHIIDVLHGSRAQKVLKFRHHNLSTYGIGKELSRKQWLHLSRQFLQQGLMTKDAEFGSLKLTAKAWDVFRGKGIVLGVLEEERVAYAQEKQGEHDQVLFETLRDKRKELADEANVPPYVILPDRTLMEMATFFPQSKESLLKIHGVGLGKLEKYGTVILDVIRLYCETHQLHERPKTDHRTATISSSKGQKRRHVVIGEAYNSGRSIGQIMAEFGIKQGTVLDHLYNYLQEGHALRSDELLGLSTIPSDQQTTIMEAFDRLGSQYLKPVFEALEETVSYEEIKILRLYYLSRQNLSCNL